MKKLLLTALMSLSVFAGSAAAMAQTATPATPPSAAAGGHAGANSGQNFATRKNEILQHISQHMTELQQRQSCVQAASTPDALKACRPPKQEGKGKCGK